MELYDVGRCTHKAVPGMYEFIQNEAHRYVDDAVLAEELRQQAANRETPGYSIEQRFFTEMCRIWVDAHRKGDFTFDVNGITFPDTVRRFQKVKEAGRQIGILTSGSADFTRILYSLPVDAGTTLADYVDHYFLGEEIGDKDNARTFARLWDSQEGDISAVFDDKISVCEAALEGMPNAGAKIYLVDRKGKYQETEGPLAERVESLQRRGVTLIQSFDDVED